MLQSRADFRTMDYIKPDKDSTIIFRKNEMEFTK